jgi:uncharacterized protein YbaP (TraB family)
MMEEVKKLQTTLKFAKQEAGKDGELLIRIGTLEEKINALTGAKSQTQTLSDLPLNRLNAAFSGLLNVLQEADTKPTTQAIKTAQDLQIALEKVAKNWQEIKNQNFMR